MKKVFFLIFVSLTLRPAPSRAAPSETATQDAPANASAWLAAARDKSLGESPEWRRVLLYTPHWVTRDTSLGDDPNFFLASDGDRSPAHELEATINAFFAPWSGEVELHPICRYPRRLAWIENQLRSKFPDELRPPCARYKEWRAEHPAKSISLVFASNYLNNPASLYGHTFIRVHRDGATGAGQAALLDDAVNFAANPTTHNPLLYPLFGMTGRFFGTFSLMPYYVKVQEYNNAESRDLFEYPVHLSPREVDSFMAALWEAGPYGIRYWYMDDNCAYVLLAMIESAKPELEMTEKFSGVVSPKDTLLVLSENAMLGTPIRRPSAMTRFKARYSLLNAAEQEVFLAQISDTESLHPGVAESSRESQAKIYDTLLEWIAWNEKLAGSKTAEKQKNLWSDALKNRASLLVKSDELDLRTVPATPPHEGHKSHRTYLTARGISGQNPEFVFGLRLTLHDLSSPLAGYSMDQETTMGDFQGVIHRNAAGRAILEWEKFTWVRIVSVPAFNTLTPSPAWTLTAQTERVWGYGKTSWHAHKIEGGMGLATGDSSRRVWLIPVAVTGHLLPYDQHWPHLGAGLRSGVILDLDSTRRILIAANADRWKAGDRFASLYETKASYSWMRRQEHEFRLTLFNKKSATTPWTRAGEITWMRYF